MKNFREWLSDYLRYFLLVLAGVLVFFLILIGYNLYKSTNEGESGGDIVVVNDTEAFTEPESEYLPETETETESETETETETETEEESNVSILSLNSAIDEDYSDKPYGETETETETEAETESSESAEEALASISTYSADTYSDDSYEDYYDDESYVEIYEEEPEVYEPDYRTLTGACNLRDGPGYDYDVITYYSAGTTVEYLGMEDGWAKVEVDGMIGYMGPSFIG